MFQEQKYTGVNFECYNLALQYQMIANCYIFPVTIL